MSEIDNNKMNNKEYDYEQDMEEQEQQTEQQPEHAQLQQFEDDYNFAKVTADINQLRIISKSNEQNLRRMQKDVEIRVTESLLTETIALINAGIQTDPNIIKLLKTRQGFMEDEQNDKIKINALAFSKKLNQMSESLTVLMTNIKRLQNKITMVEADLSAQLNQRYNSHQILIEETRSEQVKENMEMQHKVEMVSSQILDKQREMETKLNWRLNEFKTKIDSKISEELVMSYLEEAQKKMDKNMREYQLKSTIDPERIDKIEQQIGRNRLVAENGVTECQHKLHLMRSEMDSMLVKKDAFEEDKFKIEKRLQLFNTNFEDVYKRVITCEEREVVMDENIQKLLKDSDFSLSELKRINTVLINIRISEDFQRMLEEMNPAKVLELQDTVQDVKKDQGNIFKEIALAKREIQKVNAKTEIMGVMMPNKGRDKLKKEEIEQALQQFLNDHQFTNKISNIDKQLHQYKLSVEAINLLNRQVSRLQKQSDTQKLHLEIQRLEENVKRELLFIHNHLKDKTFFQDTGVGNTERPNSKGMSSINGDIVPMGEALGRRSFSMKKVQNLSTLMNSSGAGNNLIRQTIQAKSIRKL